jgi:hypothetical protein
MKKLIACLAVACLTFAAAAVWFRHELRLEQSRASALESRVAQLERTRATVQRAAAPRLEDTPPSGGGAAANRGTALPLAVTSVAAEPRPEIRGWNSQTRRQLIQNPAFREATRAQRRLEKAFRYVDLAAALQIPQETADRLIDLLVDMELRRMSEDASTAVDSRAEVSALLGKTAYEKWQDYQESLPTRYQMHDLRDQLSVTAEPLRDDQLEPLVAAVSAERRQFNDEIRAYQENVPDGQERDMRHTDLWQKHVAATHARIHASASSILSPTQLAQLDAILEELRQREAAQIQVERMMRDAKRRDALNIAKSN